MTNAIKTSSGVPSLDFSPSETFTTEQSNPDRDFLSPIYENFDHIHTGCFIKNGETCSDELSPCMTNSSECSPHNVPPSSGEMSNIYEGFSPCADYPYPFSDDNDDKVVSEFFHSALARPPCDPYPFSDDNDDKVVSEFFHSALARSPCDPYFFSNEVPTLMCDENPPPPLPNAHGPFSDVVPPLMTDPPECLLRNDSPSSGEMSNIHEDFPECQIGEQTSGLNRKNNPKLQQAMNFYLANQDQYSMSDVNRMYSLAPRALFNLNAREKQKKEREDSKRELGLPDRRARKLENAVALSKTTDPETGKQYTKTKACSLNGLAFNAISMIEVRKAKKRALRSDSLQVDDSKKGKKGKKTWRDA